MKVDSVLIFISLLFSFAWLVLKDVVTSNLLWIAVLRYVPLLLLYAKYIQWSFRAVVPILFPVFLIIFSIIGDSNYSLQGLLVVAMVPTCLYVFSKITFSHREIRILLLLVFLSYLSYLVVSLLYWNSINPNQIGFTFLILSLILFFCTYTNMSSKNAMTSLFIIVLIITTLVLILFTRSRNSILVFLLLPVAFLFRKRFEKYQVAIVWMVMIFYFVYPWVYTQLAYSSSFSSSQDIVLMDQDVFSGREIIWSYVYSQMRNPSVFFFGGIDTEWWGKSLHNSAMDIIVRYGVPSMVALSLIIVFYFKNFFKSINNKYKSLLLLMLIAMIWGLNESGMFLGYSFFLFLPYCIIHSKKTRPISFVIESGSDFED